MKDMKPATGPDMSKKAPTMPQETWSEFADGPNSRIADLEACLQKINAIRNSVIGAQNMNFSEHVYPLVAALDEAGYEGLDYAENRANLGTLIENTKKAEQERDTALAENARYREALELILPMAKGYAHQNKVGSNAEYILTAEEALEAKHD